MQHLASLSKISVATACKYYGISKDWYYQEKRKIICSLNPLKKCYKQYPNQLTIQEIITIEQLIKDSIHFGKTKTTLYYYALKNNLISCGKSTFFKYTAALGYQKIKRFKVTTIEDGIQKVAFVKDNFSKAILHVASTDGKAGSRFIKNLFQETFTKYDLLNTTKPISILSDRGSENKGKLLTWINSIKAPPLVTKITARTKEFPFSNSMAESTHSIYKTEFLHGKHSLNQQIHLLDLQRFIEYYNHHRYLTELYGYTPMEIIQGKTPNKDLYKQQIQLARKKRTIIKNLTIVV
ncbi:Integrase catalytic domain-containing protein [Tenacibaculum sp. 190130A14a]|uniref:Transposase n=1 Tax=Tenacibaculum polynesiense TaxID=3137857 RepID=A0ABP1EUV0_9FLAO